MSQWAHSPFTAEVETETGLQSLRFECCEQYMMYGKAALFKDWGIAAKIMETSDPSRHKSLGRQVKGFVDFVWQQHCREIVRQGNLHKFSQNDNLRRKLLATGDRTLVEASPKDTIWGIGLASNDPRALNPSQWRGTNWLGEALMQVRKELRTC